VGRRNGKRPMLIIPAIDLKDGRCVRLRQGDMAAQTVYAEDAGTVAARWQDSGAELIHIVDLNGAVDGSPKNLVHIQKILATVSVKIQVGGGIRNIETIRRYVELGVSRVVLGTAAVNDRSLLDEACGQFPGRIVLGLDAKGGKVAVQGWTSLSKVTTLDLLRQLSENPLAAVIYTDIARDGMLTGPNVAGLQEIAERSAFPVIASGGISHVGDLEAIRRIRPHIQGAIIGKALYDGKIDLREAIDAMKAANGSPC
jgi:phosphoribosylformimino-5-aminoimidazole carboxamide ribotide isomerase